ncbi:hypothetical protein BDV29DRAFT_187092 [Aspergillus leporis]|uniref:Enoyl reductase (ER) domain-containing protein n=1 Tax=Aspergillus leporis TaxID=41062 RepID=A0A5N5XFB0_9EURO|nr:hypothetical protein BDV29DRAFT_187092 [Aspergillus leporis]
MKNLNNKQPLMIEQVFTLKPQHSEVQVRVEWVPPAPFDVYQADAGLMAQFAQSLGDSGAGTVVAVGPNVKHLKVGDQVFGLPFHNEKGKGHRCFAMSAVVTLPTNFCTAFLTLSDKLGIELLGLDIPILIGGAGSSVGQFAVQILKHWGYRNIITTASPKHHDKIKGYGAKHIFDYRDPTIVDLINHSISSWSSLVNIRVFDCADSKFGSLLPISKIVSADVSNEAALAPGVEVHESLLGNYLQPETMPTLLAQGAIEPNMQCLMEGNTLMERARTALNIMRSGTVSGERFVWKFYFDVRFAITPLARIGIDSM